MECLECTEPDNLAPTSDSRPDNQNVAVHMSHNPPELIRQLKSKRTAALASTTKQRTKITNQMSDEENVHIVKDLIVDLDTLFNKFQEIHEQIYEQTTEEEKDKEYDYFLNKQSAALEFKNQVTQWIEVAEHRLSTSAENTRARSVVSEASRASSRSRRLSQRGSVRSMSSAASMREKERLKQAEMIAEKSLLKRRQEIEAANKELELEMNIAKSRARERVYASMIEEELCNFANESVVKSTPLTEDKVNEGNGGTTQDNVNVQNGGTTQENINVQNGGTTQENVNVQNGGRTQDNVNVQNAGATQDNVNVQNAGSTEDNVNAQTAGITEVNVNFQNASVIQDNVDATYPTNGNATESNITATKTNVTEDYVKSAQVGETERNVNAITHNNERVPTVTAAKPNTDVPYASPVKHGLNDSSSEGKEKGTYTRDVIEEATPGGLFNLCSTPVQATHLAESSFTSLLNTQIQQHKEMTAAMRLPQPRVPLFKGNILEYKPFIMAFDARIQSKTTNDADLLYYIHQHLTDEPKDLIEGCLHLPPEEGYAEARKLLDKEYGDPYKVSVAYTAQLQRWPPVKHDDATSLKRLSLFLIKCKNAMKNISYTDILNHTPHMQAVVQKLPSYLQSKWRERVLNFRQQQQRSPGFSDLVSFVEHASETNNDPVYSKDALSKLDDRARNSRPAEPSAKKPVFQNRHRPTGSLATSLANPVNSPNGAGSASPQQKPVQCPLCNKSHDLENCKDFLDKSIEERKKFITDKNMCFACYGTNHRSKGCTNKRTCATCKKPHPTTLHVQNFSIKDRGNNKSNTSTDAVNSTCTDTSKGQPTHPVVLQSIVPVKVTNKEGNCTTTYALYDNGSSGSFITESLMDELQANGTKTTLQLGTMHGQSIVNSFIIEGLTVCDLNGDNPIQLPRCYTRHEIPVSHEQIPTPQLISKLINLRSLTDKIPNLMSDVEIGLLIGSDCPLALEPLEVLPSGGQGPFAMRLRHGWTVNGPLQLTSNIRHSNNIVVKELETSKEIILPQHILNMFELDFNDHAASSDTPSLSKEDQTFLKIATENIHLVDGHYELPLPFRSPDVMLPNNREQAVKRANWQRKKMLRNEQYHLNYTKFMNDTIAKGYASKVPDCDIKTKEGKVWYIPHHGVYHPKKPEKIRVVFDCSAKYNGVSLNDKLLQGPNLTNSLVGVLTRFRQQPVAFMADIEQMFYQVKVPVHHRNFLRFLWWPNGDLNADLKEFQMNVHLFGAASSPSCANFALRSVCTDNESEFDSETISTIKKNFYVDDCLRSAKDKHSAIKLVENVKRICAKGGFNLTKFICNDRDVLKSVPEEQRSKEVKTLDLQQDELPVERALGVQWCVESDKLGFHVTISEKPITRRGILSSVSSIYDPLGIVSPFTLVAKKILQDLCLDKSIGWDTEVPEKYLVRWEKWRRQLPLLEMLALDRCLTPDGFGEVTSQQVHLFSDASSTGYGAVAYLRQKNDKNEIHCSFLLAKSRLAPVKTTTIPRLELTAATVSARLGQMLKSELDDDPDFEYHTDSTTVLRYLANQQTRFKVFVANRVQTILNLSMVRQWRYVRTKENPADDASRGLDAQELLDNQRWLNGPEFLWESEEEWPQQPFNSSEIEEGDPEVKATVNSTATVVAQDPKAAVDQIINYFSDWYRLKRAIAVYLRVRKILLERSKLKPLSKESTKARSEQEIDTMKSQSLSVTEIQNAECVIIRYVQSKIYHKELGLIAKADCRASKRRMKQTSSIHRLDPYLDNGILRVGGRLSKADIPDESIHPMILPKNHHVTTLIINDAHKTLGHAGRGHVLAKLHQRYWIVSANAAVRHVISKCVTCRKSRGKPNVQKMADLPKVRVTPAPPFSYTGVDYFGPYVIKDGRKEVKRYGAMFTCLASRAVHIEISNSLETDSFIQALRRFVARRGAVKMIRSDNGTNFVGAEAELKEALKEMDHDRIRAKLRKAEVEWIFNPPAASNFGGVWERQIRTARKVLSGLLSEHGQRLDDESLRTLMCEVEAVMNSRPLTFVSSDADDLEPLTPSHILTNKPTVILPPPGDFQREDVYLKRRWRRVQYLTNLFWSRWKTEYLNTLQQRQKWQQPKRNLVVGDVVLIKDEGAPRNSWCMGVVEATEPDKQGHVRAANVRTKSSQLRRPVNKLVLLLPKEEQ